MLDCRNLEDVKKALTDSLNSAKFEKELWEKVEVCKKKDGNDFAVVSKSFKNSDYGAPSYMDKFHPEISVAGRNLANGRWESYSLTAYTYVDTLDADDERKNKAVKPNTWSREVYVLTPDEVLVRIKGHILDLRLRIAKLEKELEIADAVGRKFINAIVDAVEELKKDTACARLNESEKWNHSSLEYRLIEVLDNAHYTKLEWEKS